MILNLFSDGGARGNPGPAATGVVIKNEKGIILSKYGRYLGYTTNNVAEYSAVLLAVKWLTKQLRVMNTLRDKNEELIINLDSQLVERQLNKKYKIKNQNLKIIYDKIELLISNHKLEINFVWNYRDKNHLADSLVNEELDKML